MAMKSMPAAPKMTSGEFDEVLARLESLDKRAGKSQKSGEITYNFKVTGVKDLELANKQYERFQALNKNSKGNYFTTEADALEKVTRAYTRYTDAKLESDKKTARGDLVRWTNAYRARNDFDQSKIAPQILQTASGLEKELNGPSGKGYRHYSIDAFKEIFDVMREMQKNGIDMSQFSKGLQLALTLTGNGQPDILKILNEKQAELKQIEKLFEEYKQLEAYFSREQSAAAELVRGDFKGRITFEKEQEIQGRILRYIDLGGDPSKFQYKLSHKQARGAKGEKIVGDIGGVDEAESTLVSLQDYIDGINDEEIIIRIPDSTTQLVESLADKIARLREEIEALKSGKIPEAIGGSERPTSEKHLTFTHTLTTPTPDGGSRTVTHSSGSSTTTGTSSGVDVAVQQQDHLQSEMNETLQESQETALAIGNMGNAVGTAGNQIHNNMVTAINSVEDLIAAINELEKIYGQFKRISPDFEYKYGGDYIDLIHKVDGIDVSDYNLTDASKENLDNIKGKLLEIYKLYKNVKSAIKNTDGWFKGVLYNEGDLEKLRNNFKAYALSYYELSQEYNERKEASAEDFRRNGLSTESFEYAEPLSEIVAKMTKEFKGYSLEVILNSEAVKAGNQAYIEEKNLVDLANESLIKRYNILRNMVYDFGQRKGAGSNALALVEDAIPYIDEDFPNYDTPWGDNGRVYKSGNLELPATFNVLQEVLRLLGLVPAAAQEASTAFNDMYNARTQQGQYPMELERIIEDLDGKIAVEGLPFEQALERLNEKAKELGYTFDETAQKWMKLASEPNTNINIGDYAQKNDDELYASAMNLALKRENIFKEMAEREISLANASTGETKLMYAKMASDTFGMFKNGASEYDILTKIEETDRLIQDIMSKLEVEKDPAILISLNQQLDEAKIKFLALEEAFKDIFARTSTKGFDLDGGAIERYWNAQRKVVSLKGDDGTKRKFDIATMDEEHFNSLTSEIKSEKDLAAALDQRMAKMVELTKAYDAQDEVATRLYALYDSLRSQGLDYSEEYDAWKKQIDLMDKDDFLAERNDILNEYNILKQIQLKWEQAASSPQKLLFDFSDDDFNQIMSEIDAIINKLKEASQQSQTPSGDTLFADASADAHKRAADAAKEHADAANLAALAERDAGSVLPPSVSPTIDNFQRLLLLIEQLGTDIGKVLAVLGSLDDTGGAATITLQFVQLAEEISTVVLSIRQLGDAIKSINFLAVFNVGSGNSVTAKASELSRASILALNDYRTAYEELMKVVGEENIGHLSRGHGDLVRSMYLASTLIGGKSRSGQIEGYRQMIDILKELSSLHGIDLSQWSSLFEQAAIDSDSALKKITSGEKDVENTTRNLSTLLNGNNSFNFQIITDQVNKIIDALNLLKQTFEKGLGLETVDDTLASYLDTLLHKLEDVRKAAIDMTHAFSEMLNKLNSNFVILATPLISIGDGSTQESLLQEAEAVSQLKNKITEIPEAVDIKTLAFRSELVEVDNLIDLEISKIEELAETLRNVFKNDGIDVSWLQELTTLLSNIKKGTSQNLNDVSNAIVLLAQSFSQFSQTPINTEAMSSINELLNHGEQLAALSKILNTSQQKISQVKKAAGIDEKAMRTRDADRDKYLANLGKYYDLLDALNKRDAYGKEDTRSFEHLATQERLFQQIESYEKHIQELRNSGVLISQQEEEALKKRAEYMAKLAENNKKYTEDVEKTKQDAFDQKVSKSQKMTDSLEKKINGLEFGKKFFGDEFDTKLANIKKDFEQLRNIDIVDDKDLDKAATLLESIRDAIKEIEGDKSFTKAKDQAVSNLKSRAARWLTGNTKAPDDIRAQIEALYNELNSGSDISTERLNEMSSALSDIDAKAHMAGESGRAFADTLKGSFGNLARYLLSFASFYRVIGIIKQGVTIVKDLDTALTEMRKVSNESLKSLQEYQSQTFSMADKVGTTSKQLQLSTADWLRLGESFEEAQQSAQSSTLLMNVSEFGDINQATESLVSMSQAYKELDKMEIIDKLNNIGQWPNSIVICLVA